MVNNRGQTLGVAILTGIFILIIGFAITNLLMPEVTDVRTNLNCSSADEITDGTKILCLVFDLVVPMYIWAILGLVIGGILTYLAIR